LVAGDPDREILLPDSTPAVPGAAKMSYVFAARLRAARTLLPDDAVLHGDTALWVHGIDWFTEDDSPIDVAFLRRDRIRRRPHLRVRARSFHRDDVVDSPWGPVTSVERTAYDVARDPLVHRSIPRLDALARVTDPLTNIRRTPRPGVVVPSPCGIDLDGVQAVVDRNSGARWIRRVHEALALMDGGAESPPESKLRLVVVTAGFPRLETQIEVFDGARFVARLDMGWREHKIGIEYDGEYHSLKVQASKDAVRAEDVCSRGWRLVNVDKERLADEGELLQTLRRMRLDT
jgi:hypothetical protein